jgi:hypothetical protein
VAATQRLNLIRKERKTMSMQNEMPRRGHAARLSTSETLRQRMICTCVVLGLLPGAWPGAKARAEAPSSPESFWVLAVGNAITAFDASPRLLRTLERDREAIPDSLPFLIPPNAAETAETLSLGDPIFRHSLPGPATDLLLPETPGGLVYVATRRGLVQFDPAHAGRAPELLLPGWDLSAVERMRDGTLLVLERAYDDQMRGALPAHLFTLRPGVDALPDTALVCSAGSRELVWAPGDSLLWVPRINGRTLDRVVHRDGRWEKSEVVVVPKVWNEEQLGLYPAFASPGGDVLLVENGRGQRPRLREIDPAGRTKVLYDWKRGVRPISGAYAPEGHLLVLNGVTSLSIVDTEHWTAYDQNVVQYNISVALSPDGAWIVTSGLSRDQEPRSEVLLRRRGSPRAALVWLNDPVAITALLPAPARP